LGWHIPEMGGFMKRHLQIFALIALTSGCATELVSSNTRSVTISAIYAKKDEAFKLAEAECKKSNRIARLVPRDSEMSTLWTFDCVE
jgi:hypothetical protein